MQKALKLDGPMRALALSLGGAAVMAVIAMLIPVSVFETITGATGISELVPATAAPLGDTARALIAFLFAAGTFAGLAAILLRQPVKQPMRAAPIASDQVEPMHAEPSLFATLRQKVAAFMESRRSGPVVTELSDLPKLRAGDAHPDAPPRRPISANRDFGEVEAPPALPISPMVEAIPDAAPMVTTPEALPLPAVEQSAPVAEPISVPETVREPVQPAIVESAPDFASVNSMVDRLELALTQRQSQLDRLETLATAQQAASTVIDVAANSSVSEQAEIAVNEIASPPPLEVVPTAQPAQASAANEDMDEALRSALETLQRMNARSR